MSSFVVSSRKYRPHLFAEIKGQQHVVDTLRNAVKKDQVAQAFLFCGLKGSGKTTSARILAQCINCEQITAAGEPCQVCSSCEQFRSQKSLNIHELDAASHNSAEDMRQIVEQMRFHPPGGKKTVIIIDEAHMLSNAALNVLLKPLEDTPRHIVFILITTEKHKIIPTIISRCQVFEFHSIKQKDIIAQLSYVAQKESITVEPAVLELISEKSGGSLRDALSMFDLLATAQSNKNITYSQALQQLHLVDEQFYFDLTDAVQQNDTEQVLLTYEQVMRLGFDGQQFLSGWSQHLRNLLVAKTTKTLPLLKVATHLKKKYSEQAHNTNKDFLYQVLAITHEAALHYKNSLTPRLYMELVLVKAAQVKKQQIAVKVSMPPKAAAPSKPYNAAAAPPHQELAERSTPYGKSHKKIDTPTKKTPPSTPSYLTKNKIPSLKQLSNKVKQQQPSKEAPPSPPEERAPNKPGTEGKIVSKEEVTPYWQAYAAQLKERNNKAATLFNLPINIEKNNIIIQVQNHLHEKEFLAIQKELIPYLRGKTGIPTLMINTKLISNHSPTPTPPKVASKEEKLDALIKSNSAIGKLKQSLDLIVS